LFTALQIRPIETIVDVLCPHSLTRSSAKTYVSLNQTWSTVLDNPAIRIASAGTIVPYNDSLH
jgi:hypothetical protein